ncbi:phosphoenolpyruvate carboxykinase (GTP) [Anaeromassilibacillus senegalensis]|uniref:Phosphoenolpyruvate carboxykinase [GTP] n=1 Tax=Anaeromassilibacillus senegalensis TaxID=1673717 RepID=A0ABS9CMY8_9FIRM|nr:phosphoenolpyruvate carboxykinase (GTP) [Anaeromassilibacillus senegalensis]MCF2652521.1 phosphoenolpyruvate carboxykinase (GTP) [Anaeromassilibacillus senegalensis]
MTNNKTILAWIDEMKALVNPDQIVWIDGSEEQLEALRKEACESGEMIKLNQEKLPGCYYHRTAPNDVARVEDRTLICSRKEEDAGPTNHWKDPQEAYKMLYDIARGSYKGRTMYVIPYSMGPVGSPLAKIGVELTDSIYVVLNMSIMTRVGQKVMDVLGDSNDWVRGLHCKCDVDPEKRWICQFPEDNTIISVNSAYGGNVLLGKKCFALRIASYQAKNEGWMAEHMLILGVENPKGEVKYVCAAFPSACGKTNLAMMIPPEGYKAKGYKVWTVGDDIAWMRKGEDGRLYAINPENGFFGVAPGTNMKSNPNALISTQKGTIFTNVARNLDDNTVWWESLDKNPPVNAEEWKGAKVNGPEYIAEGNKLAHPNSRFTAPTANCPCLSSEFENPKGVPVSAIIFGGRRPDTVPLVYQSRSWNNGVFIGSITGSETTAAAAGAVGVVRRDPMAMLPFCGYHMGDYFKHWIEMGEVLGDKAPKIFNVNWFRVDEDGHFIWPGFGDNLRVLEWILKRCDGEVDAVETAIGYVPKAEDINLEGLDFSVETLKSILAVDNAKWAKEATGVEEFYKKFGDKLPAELRAELEGLKSRVNA